MTHLVRTTQKSLFQTDVAGRRDSETQEAGKVCDTFPGFPQAPPGPLSVSPVTTPEDARTVARAQYPCYDWLSVENLEPRMRGKHY
jgi:hypothetical protein